MHKFNLQGVVRFTQTDSETCIIDGTLDGLNPGEHGLAIHECGDISGGCSTGKSFSEALILASVNPQYEKKCSLIYQFLHENYKLRTFCVHKLFWMSKQKQKIVYVHNMFWACSFHVRTGKSMNNLLPYCGLVDARIRASEKDLPVQLETTTILEMWDMGALLTASITVTLGILAM